MPATPSSSPAAEKDTIMATAAPITAIDDRIARAAATTGAATVERLPFDLSLLDQGIFVDIDVIGLGPLERKLTLDLIGVTLPKGAAAHLSAPSARMLPDEYAAPLSGYAKQAHALLKRLSYTFKLTEALYQTKAWRWVPPTAWDDFDQGLAALQANLDAAKQKALDDYETVILPTMTDLFQRILADSARRLIATGADIGDVEEWATATLPALITQIPTPQDIQSIAIERRIGVFYLGSEMLAEQQETRKRRAEIEEQETSLRILRMQERATQCQLFEDQQARDRERREEQALADRIRAQKEAELKKQLATINSPLQEMTEQLMSTVHRSATTVLESLKENNRLTATASAALNKLIRLYRIMNMSNTPDADAIMAELQRIQDGKKAIKIHKTSSQATNTALKHLLTSLQTVAHDAAKTIIDGPTVELGDIEL